MRVLAGVAALVAAPVAHAGPPVLPSQHAHERVCGLPASGHAGCHAEVITDPAGRPIQSSNPNGYRPADLQSAYGVAAAAARRGGAETVAVVDAFDDPTAAADLATYRSTMGLPACTAASGCFRKVNQSGGTTMPSVSASWAQEVSLDLDMVSAICPNCHILLVEASSSSVGDLAAAVDEAAALGATQISNSYGSPEFAGETDYESSYDHPGIALTASSGDDGYGVQFPAASRYVTAVGGTSLTPDAGSARGWTETAWSGSGSGCSAYVDKPAFQTDSACTRRTVVDVAAVADPNTGVAIYDSTKYQGSSGWLVFGGTSAAAPVVAGIDALVGPAAASVSFSYDHAAMLNDVISGSNGACPDAYLCTAGPGYDGVTGLGSPSGALVGGPTASTAPATDVTETSATVGGTVDPEGQATTYAFQYGTSATYGSQAPGSEQDAGAGTSDVPVSLDLAALSPGTTYHYRLVAKNAWGTAYGQDQTFTTVAAPAAAGDATAAPDASPASPAAPDGTTSDPSAAPVPVDTAGDPASGTPPPTTTSPSTPPLDAGSTDGSVLGSAGSEDVVRRVRVEQSADGRYDVRQGLRVSVTCGSACAIAARLVTPGGRALIVGAGRAHGAGGAARTVHVRLSQRGSRLLRHHGVLRLTLRLVVTEGAGRRVAVTRSIRLAR